jgi:carbonic anhydrase/acetyltransferase-like protein (isoleucine patch superfamily)
MALIKTLLNKTPKYGDNCFFAETAVIIGDVIMGNECSVWYNAVIRGDVHSIKMGNKVNVQDNATIHATYQKSPTIIGNNVSIAHNAVVHGCTIHDNVLIGIGAVILDDVIIESNCVIAAGAVVTKGMILKTGGVYAGIPAKRIKDLDEKLITGEIDRIANNYIKYASWYKEV